MIAISTGITLHTKRTCNQCECRFQKVSIIDTIGCLHFSIFGGDKGLIFAQDYTSFYSMVTNYMTMVKPKIRLQGKNETFLRQSSSESRFQLVFAQPYHQIKLNKILCNAESA